MIVVDTSAIVAIIAQEPEASAFRSAIKQNLQLAMSAFTVFECRTVERGPRLAAFGARGLLCAGGGSARFMRPRHA